MNDPGPAKASRPTAAEKPAGRRRRALKIAAVCLLQLFAIVLLAESIVRVGGLDRPLGGAVWFGGPDDPLHQTDSLLFYKMRPDLQIEWQNAAVTTNHLGLRGVEVGPKQAREFRILSLGESSTFGAMVGDGKTYSARLQRLLQERDETRSYRVINAGVCGYSSFQSLTYLEHRGLQLEPDLVLFYHEINDDLPVAVSDPQRFAFTHERWHRQLADWSATYRALSSWAMDRKRRQLSPPPENADQSPAPRAEEPAAKIAGKAETPTDLVPRVSSRQRREIFAQLADLCDAHGITLVLIHPAYAQSARHTCELTEFCQQTGVHLFEAYDWLHPPGAEQREFFADECHPNRQGHQRLAEGLAQTLQPIIESRTAAQQPEADAADRGRATQ